MGEVQGWRRVSAAANSDHETVRTRARRFAIIALTALFLVPLTLVIVQLL